MALSSGGCERRINGKNRLENNDLEIALNWVYIREHFNQF